MSKVGHILSIPYAGKTLRYYVIAQYSRNGLTSYVVSEWREASQSFMEYREDSYFFQEKGAYFSKAPFVMPERIKAMSRAYRLQQILKKSSKRITRARLYGNVSYVQNELVDTLHGLYLLPTLQTMEWREVDSRYMTQVKALHAKLSSMFWQEMELAGLAGGFSQADKIEFEQWLDAVASDSDSIE